MTANQSNSSTADSGLPQIEHWINGRATQPASAQYLNSTDPRDRSAAFAIADGDDRDINNAVQAAAAAAEPWKARTTADRSESLSALGLAIRDNLSELADAESTETGKLLPQARAELLAAAGYFEYYAAVVRTLHGSTIDQGPKQHTYTRHEPFGVVAIIAPWNAPLNQTARGAAPALAAGNVVVAKPSEFTSAATVKFAQLATQAGLPNGVFNVVTGTGQQVGAPLVRHPDVRRVTFTGSVSTGQAIGHIAADRIVPLTLELGGKSPVIVFSDADLDGAARACAATVLLNSGQICSATTRLLVQRSVQDELLQKTADLLANAVPGRDFGPIITETQFAKVLDFFESATREGAEVVTGGTHYQEGPAATGRYVTPTLYRNATPEMTIVQEEVFGPVLSATPFDSEAEAITLANDTDFGLAGAVWSNDGARGIRVAERIQAGQVAINGGLLSLETPFGGYKASGYGREKGADAIYEYTQVKTISMAL